jgi:hypothetical protein
VQQIVDFFRKRGSLVFIATLDASKAFDRIDHRCLFNKLNERGVPSCLTEVLSNWYSKLTAMVRWNNCLSMSFNIRAGVRQGGILSPLLFNVYMDDLSTQLSLCGSGCHINRKFVGCVMYADDILLMSASVRGLQLLLNITFAYCVDVGLLLNAKKSNCAIIGGNGHLKIDNMMLGGQSIEWSNNIKYLGVNFEVGKRLKVDCSVIKRRFYAAFNGVLYNCKHADENVKLHLITSFCLPILTYCLGALQFSQKEIDEIGVCWNDVFRRIYGFHKWESVSLTQFFTGNTSFAHMVQFHNWNFIDSVRSEPSGDVPELVKFVYDVRKYEAGVFVNYGDLYNFYGTSRVGKRSAILEVFGRQVMM